MMRAVAVLVGEAAVDSVAGAEGLQFGVGREDQPMLNRAGGQAPLELGVEASTGAAGAVDRVAGKQVAVG